MQRPKLVRPTPQQTTRKTIRGMVTKNLLALLLTGHPLWLMENIVHSWIDWVVNKNFCTDNKLLNVWVHLATCLSVDGLIHGTWHEIVESLSWGWYADIGWSIDYDINHSSMSSSTDVSSSMMADISYDTDVSHNVSDTADISNTVSQTHKPMSAIMKAKMQAMQVIDVSGMEWYDPTMWQDFTQMYQIADTQWIIDHTGHHHWWDAHAGRSHGDHSWHSHEIHEDHADHVGHDHDHWGHGILPILWWAIVEEYGPTMYKVTKQRTQSFVEDLFNMSPASDMTIIKKSELSKLGNNTVSKPKKGKVVKFEPNIVAETKQNNKGNIIPFAPRDSLIKKAA